MASHREILEELTDRQVLGDVGDSVHNMSSHTLLHHSYGHIGEVFELWEFPALLQEA